MAGSDPKSDRPADSMTRAQVLKPGQAPPSDPLRTEFRDPDGLALELIRRQWVTPFQAGRPLSEQADDLALGPYDLLELLGEGGMGRVYKARHRLMNRVVALKLIRTDLLASDEARRRFHREIEAAARVWHPNLVAALDAAPVGDSFVLVMEFVEGSTLAALLRSEGVPPIRHACDWVRQAALGLGHAHEQGLIHRDVKPSNLMRTARGNVIKVTDLGLARLDLLGDRGPGTTPGREVETLTESGVVIGTPDYLAPEQARSPRDADPRSDIYSLGCTLYHLLTGRPPFPGGSLTQKLLWHQTAEPPDPSRLRPSVPAGLSQAVLKMIAKRPEQRYANAAAVAVALEPYCAASAMKTLPTPEPSHPHDLSIEIEPARTASTPVVRHEPHDTATYDLAGAAAAPPPEAEPEPLARPAGPEDDSWWRDELAAKPPPPADPEPTPAPPHRPPAAAAKGGRLGLAAAVAAVFAAAAGLLYLLTR